MKKLTNITSAFTEIHPDNFINLKKTILGEYTLVYHLNDGYSVTNFNQIHSKHQLLFQKITEKNKQLNLMIVDSCFPLLLSDLVLELLLNKTSSFEQYSNSKKNIMINDKIFDQHYIVFKLKSFINGLLYANIATDEAYKEFNYTNRIYCLKNHGEAIQYYTLFERLELCDLLFNKAILEIDKSKSSIQKDTAHIYLKISFK